jgi:Asp-tRNA(Asn)/Glu-tRNA(Gln) amidotransferase A subunit family amidase
MSGPALYGLGVRELLAGYANHSFTPCEVIDALIGHVTRCDKTLGALYAFDPAGARQSATESTRRWAAGTPRGKLDGVPATIKDLIKTRGTPTPLGTAATELVPAAEDAPPAARLREAGAIIFAKTTMPDYGMLSSGLSSFHPLTRNPWNLWKNPGGSSSGAGAAAAAFFGPMHVGTDIGGSIRLPAAWCGLVGFKPSLGRVPIDPYYTARCAGPMTRTVDDAAFMMEVLAQPDARDATSLPPLPVNWHARIEGVKGLRIGLMMEAGCGLPVDPQVAAAVLAAARMFADEGAEIAPVESVLTREILDGIDIFWRTRSWDDIARLPEDRRRKILPYIREWAAKGEHATGREVVAGFNRSFELRRRCAALFTRVDAVLSPVSPTLTFPADWASPLNNPARPFDHITFTAPWNFSEQPAISLNCGFSAEGMPIGLQIVTPRFADEQAVALARWFEERRGAITNWPTEFRLGPAEA